MEEQYKTPEAKRMKNAEYRRSRWATDPKYREACKAKQKRREQSDEYKAKRRAKYRAAHPIVTERQRIMAAAFERRRTGIPNYRYTPQPEQFKKMREDTHRDSAQDAYEKVQKGIDKMICNVRNGSVSKYIGKSNYDNLRKRVEELDIIEDEMRTLDTLNDWSRISILNHKKACIRKDFEPFVKRPDRYRDNV